ncbi:MAG: thrombospondin type 3 repeat-containing protein [Acidobacteriota bacterium]
MDGEDAIGPGKTMSLALTRGVVSALLVGVLTAAFAQAQPLPGQVIQDPDNPTQYIRVGRGPVYLAGVGDPENFLFRGTRLPDGTRDGDQDQLLDDLIEHGGNGIYVMSLRSSGGDGPADHNPGIGGVLSAGIDDRVLDQWAGWFDRANANDIITYFFIFDDGSRPWGSTGVDVPDGEREYIEAIVQRFDYLENLIWVVSEEADLTWPAGRQGNQARVIAEADRHGHPVGLQHFQGRVQAPDCTGVYAPDAPWITHHGLAQNHGNCVRRGFWATTHEKIVANWHYGNDRGYTISMVELFRSERGRGHGGIPLEDMVELNWHVGLGGAGFLALCDFCTDHIVPNDRLPYFRIQQQFFEATDFHTMAPRDDLALDSMQFVLANEGTSYIGYAEDVVEGELLGIAGLPAGLHDIWWYDVYTGDNLWDRTLNLLGGDQSFPVPAGLGTTVALWLTPSPDGDGDLILDGDDNCPDVPNVDQLDTDADGAGDLCDPCVLDPLDDVDDDSLCADVDNCPEQANTTQDDWDSDGAGDLCDVCPRDALDDGDADGACANVDNCPDLANPLQVDLDGDRQGDACDPCPLDALDDADADGSCADVDNCPELANVDQADLDGDGRGDACDPCPADALDDVDADGLCAELDHCPDSANPAQADLDGDGLGDACDEDLDGDGSLNVEDCRVDDPGDGVPASVVADLRVTLGPGGATLALSWTAPVEGLVFAESGHEILQGELDELRTRRDFTGTCATTSDRVPEWSADLPASSRYYLIRGVNDCGPGELRLTTSREDLAVMTPAPCP